MSGALKAGVTLLVVAFLGFYLFTDPTGAGHALKSGASGGWHGLGAVFDALMKFFDALVH